MHRFEISSKFGVESFEFMQSTICKQRAVPVPWLSPSTKVSWERERESLKSWVLFNGSSILESLLQKRNWKNIKNGKHQEIFPNPKPKPEAWGHSVKLSSWPTVMWKWRLSDFGAKQLYLHVSLPIPPSFCNFSRCSFAFFDSLVRQCWLNNNYKIHLFHRNS